MPLYEVLGGDKNSVVIEIGSRYARVGFVSEYFPRAIVRSRQIVKNGLTNLLDIEEPETLIGALKDFIESIYFKFLAVNPKDRKVIIVESVFFPTRFRNALVKVFIRHFDVPGVLLVPCHLMAMMTLVIPSALVVDLGYSDCVVTPVIEGVTLIDSTEFSQLGSKAIHDRIMLELIEKNARIKDGDEEFIIKDRLSEEILEDIKVKCCFVAPFDRGNRLAEIKLETLMESDAEPMTTLIGSLVTGPPPDTDYPISGTRTLFIPGHVRESAAEALFELVGEEANVATLILDSLINCPIDSRKSLAENIVIIGGTSMMPGFRHRLINELTFLVKNCDKYKVKLHFDSFKFHTLPCKENYAGWLGASIFGSTDAINSRITTRDQYLKNQFPRDWSEA